MIWEQGWGPLICIVYIFLFSIGFGKTNQRGLFISLEYLLYSCNKDNVKKRNKIWGISIKTKRKKTRGLSKIRFSQPLVQTPKNDIILGVKKKGNNEICPLYPHIWDRRKEIMQK